MAGLRFQAIAGLRVGKRDGEEDGKCEETDYVEQWEGHGTTFHYE